MQGRFHGMQIGGMDGKLFTVFDPPWWKVHLWVWWLWRSYVEHRLDRLWRAVTFWVKRQSRAAFQTGKVEVRLGGTAQTVRVYRDTQQWLSWMPPESVATRVAVRSAMDNQPDDSLPSSVGVHPNERGL
jgi:hypothetical protein